MRSKLEEILNLYEKDSSKIVFITDSKEILAKQFITDIYSLANIWKDLLSNKQKIALSIEDIYFFCCAWIACQLLGKTTVMLPNNQPGTIAKLKSEYDAIMFDDDINFNTEKAEKLSVRNTQSIFFTSGSTEEYKKYVKNTANIEKESTAINNKVKKFDIENTQIYSTVSHHHLYGFSFFIIWPLLNQKIIHTTRLFIPELINEKLAKDNAILITTPLIISYLRTKIDNTKNCLLISSASELKHDNAKEFGKYYNIPILEIYGSTETGIIAYRQQSKDKCWSTFEKVNISTKNSQLIVKSPFFEESKHITQDIVEIHTDNSFTLKGRVDRIVKIAGKRLSLPHMEKILIRNPLIKDAICIKRKSYREYIAVLICLSMTQSSTLCQLEKQNLIYKFKKYLKKYFDITTVPKQWKFVDNIPANTQGKRTLDIILKEFEA